MYIIYPISRRLQDEHRFYTSSHDHDLPYCFLHHVYFAHDTLLQPTRTRVSTASVWLGHGFAFQSVAEVGRSHTCERTQWVGGTYRCSQALKAARSFHAGRGLLTRQGTHTVTIARNILTNGTLEPGRVPQQQPEFSPLILLDLTTSVLLEDVGWVLNVSWLKKYTGSVRQRLPSTCGT